MGRKKVIQKQPIEKLSSETIVEITEDSSSEEEGYTEETPIVKPKTKKPRTAKQLENDQRLRDRKKKKVEPVIDEMDISRHPVKPVAIDEDDKPLTARQMKAYMAQMNQPKEAPVKKPRKPRATKSEMAARRKVVAETSTPVAPPPPALVRSKPEMLFV